MNIFLVSYEMYNDSSGTRLYKLIYADTFEQAEVKLGESMTQDWWNIRNETIK